MTDKLTRVMDMLPYIETKLVSVPEDAAYTNDFIGECEAFTADDTHDFDDQVDPLVDAVNDMLATGNRLKIWESLGDNGPRRQNLLIQKFIALGEICGIVAILKRVLFIKTMGRRGSKFVNVGRVLKTSQKIWANRLLSFIQLIESTGLKGIHHLIVDGQPRKNNQQI